MNYYGGAIAYFPKITYQRYQKIYRFFSPLEKVWEAEIDDLVKAGLEENISYEFITWREKFSLDKMVEEMLKENISIATLDDPRYPKLLKEIIDPPFVLFVRGALPSERPTISVVGTRKCTLYGKQVTEELSRQLAEQGVAVVSGLALGIDGIAHEAVLSAKGQTVAVLGSGVDKKHIYPAAHQHLAERIIAEDGAVVSEYPPGFMPTQYSFPARNRVIAGLSLGTLITEAPTQSGALITGKFALDYNREVFAIPHPITSMQGQGGNNLLKMGAHLVTNAQDILDELQIHHVKEIISNNKILPSTPTEAVLLPILTKEPQHVDVIIKISGLPSGQITSALTMMEMKGMVKNVGGMMYVVK